MTLLLWILGGVLLVILLAVVLPVDLDLRLLADDTVHYRVSARPFGGVMPPVKIAATGRKPLSASKSEKDNKSDTADQHGRGPAMIQAAPDLVAGLLGAFQIKALSLDGKFGLSDPAGTGQLFGALTPVIYGTSGMHRVRVSVQPVFDRACLSGEAYAVLRITPAALLPPVFRFAWRVFGPSG